MHQMFSVHTTPEEFKTATITGHLDLCLKKTRAGKSPDYREDIAVKKLRFQLFSVHMKTKIRPAFTNSFDLKSVFQKLRFRDGLVWRAGLTVEINLRFQISRA